MKLLIYDLDGTLIDSKLDIANSVNWTLGQLGLSPVANEVVYSYVGNGVRPLIAKSVGEEEGPRFNEALKIFKAHYLEHLLDHTGAFPGVIKVLNHFQKKKQAILTNKPKFFTEPILKGLSIDHYFQAVIGSEEGFPKKPDPTSIRHLLEKFHCLPDKGVMVGDSKVDIETGKAAGILTCSVTYGFRGREEVEESRPDFIIHHPEELCSLLV